MVSVEFLGGHIIKYRHMHQWFRVVTQHRCIITFIFTDNYDLFTIRASSSNEVRPSICQNIPPKHGMFYIFQYIVWFGGGGKCLTDPRSVICISIVGDKWVNGRTWCRYYIYLSLSQDPTVIKARIKGFLDQATTQRYNMSERKR